MTTFIAIVCALAYVVAAWKHMRVRHNDRALIFRLLHMARMMVFLGLILMVVQSEPALASAMFILTGFNILIWHIDDGLAIRGGRASNNPTTDLFRGVHQRG